MSNAEEQPTMNSKSASSGLSGAAATKIANLRAVVSELLNIIDADDDDAAAVDAVERALRVLHETRPTR